MLQIGSNFAWEQQVNCFVRSASVQVWKHWKPHPGERRAELVWSLFIYLSFNLNSMFEMRPAMLLSAVALWLKWEKPFYLFLSPRQWPFFCVQMLQCVDNIPVGFGGGLSQCWWHFDPPPSLPPPLPVLNSPLESPFACTAVLLRNLCVVPQTAAAALESLILWPSHHRNPAFCFSFFVCSHRSGILWISWHQCGNHLDVCTFFATPTFICTRPLPRSGLTSPLNNRAGSFFESLGRVSGGHH